MAHVILIIRKLRMTAGMLDTGVLFITILMDTYSLMSPRYILGNGNAGSDNGSWNGHLNKESEAGYWNGIEMSKLMLNQSIN